MNTQVQTYEENNKVLKNTYGLLALTTGFSALMAYLNMSLLIKITPLVVLGLYFGMVWFTYKFKDSALGLVGAFAITGLLGFTLGPIIESYISNINNGGTLVMQAFLGTALTFVGVNLYVQKYKPQLNESWLPILFWTMMIAVAIGLVNYYFLNMPILSVLLSGVILIVSVVYLVFQTNSIINGGETNYILATIGIFASLYNIFVSLLNILGFASDE
jgi:modulator of FtsH protease